MASLTLGQHADQQLFLQKLTSNEKKKIFRKSSSDMKSRRSAVATESKVGKVAAAVSGPSASLNHSHLAGHRGATENGVGTSHVVDHVQQPRSTQGAVADGNIYTVGSSKRGDLRATLTVAVDTSLTPQNKSRKDGENGKAKKLKRSPDRSNGDTSCAQVCSPVEGCQEISVKDTRASKSNGSANGHMHFHRPGGKRSSQITVHQNLDFRSLSDESGGWHHGDRMPVLTQGRSGVVKMMRTDPPRREAWSIFSQEDPRVKPEKGEGHLFTSRSVTQDWCDACNRQVDDEALKCQRPHHGVSLAVTLQATGSPVRRSLPPCLFSSAPLKPTPRRVACAHWAVPPVRDERTGWESGLVTAGESGSFPRTAVCTATRDSRVPRETPPDFPSVARSRSVDTGGTADAGCRAREGSERAERTCRDRGPLPHRSASASGSGPGVGAGPERGNDAGPAQIAAGAPRCPASGMTPERRAEASATACFGQVSRRLGRLFRRLPKSRSWSEGLRLVRRSSSSSSLVFSDCSYTCHLECERLVQLDCNQRDKQSEDTSALTPQDKAGPGGSSSSLRAPPWAAITLLSGRAKPPERVHFLIGGV
ncbi:hypothetical protein AAFF_G00095720 [Aldrovandia affinis]|uniref:Uncharacterized protein n=1 Tax=Aldrovandia affinis TaxID=143900 RepID=A0AAD7RVX0_9TELE|nr:hypothetical protein AAFF_G00095720 [Aldrovandia affinis]